MSGKTVTTLPSILSLPEMVEEMLRSDDVEMIRLGAMWITQNRPQRTWQDYMSITQNKYATYVETICGEPQIAIVEIPEWSSHGFTTTTTNSYGRTVSVYTGRAGYQLITQTIKNQGI